MRVMAVDYGEARTGIAVSDESASLVGEAWIIREKNQSAVAEAISAEVLSRNVQTVVVGYPKNMNGTVGPQALKSERLADHLRLICDAEVILWDERMTTVSAHRILDNAGRYGKKRSKSVDAVAASLILESYLSYRKR
ncbi:MAG: Holliday junction resolvase RuvX [Oscillospiraceae bacterium]|nr:Holliday junction resolvase RuvX [Oscillospiraceae bacterium]